MVFMTIDDQVLIIIIDKLIIAIILLIAGYLVKRSIEKYKSDEQKKIEKFKADEEWWRQITKDRAKAYIKLWKLTEIASPSRTKEFNKEEKKDFFEKLTNLYYDEGNALYLSLYAVDKFLKARKLVSSKSTAELDKIKTAFSRLRTQLKVDMRIYSKKDANTKLPIIEKKGVKYGHADS
jgi:hypothetical protein